MAEETEKKVDLKSWRVSPDFLSEGEVQLATFETEEEAEEWVKKHAPDGTYTGPDIDGNQVTVEEVQSWWAEDGTDASGVDAELVPVTGYIPKPEENESEETDS